MTTVRSRERRARKPRRQPAASLLSIDLVSPRGTQDTPAIAAAECTGAVDTPGASEAREATATQASRPTASVELQRALLDAAEELVASETHDLAETVAGSDLVEAPAASRRPKPHADPEAPALSHERGEEDLDDASVPPEASQLIHGPATWQVPGPLDVEPAPAADPLPVDELHATLCGPEPADSASTREAAAEVEVTETSEALEPASMPQSGRADPAPGGDDGEASEPAAESVETQTEAEFRSLPPFADIEAYWRWLKGQRAYPSAYEIDPLEVSRRWPYSLLIYRSPGGGPLEVQKVYAEAATASAVNPFAQDEGSRISSWVLDLAQRAARRGAPLSERQRFAMATGASVLVGRAVPLSDDPEDIDHVLCHVDQAT